jgi:hypothetical protein
MQSFFPFDAGAGSAITEAQWQKMAKRWLNTGVIEDYLNELAVTADGSGMTVSVATGGAWVEGFYFDSDAAEALTIAAADASNERIDRIVVRLDRVANTVALAVLQGTAAASPTAPALTQTDSLYELGLATVSVDAAVGVIAADQVTDTRSYSGNLSRSEGNAAYVAQGAGVTQRTSTSESTTSATYTDLASVGPTRDVTVTGSGKILVIVHAFITNTAGAEGGLMSFALSGANVVAASDVDALRLNSTSESGASAVHLIGGLAAGMTTVTAKYRSSSSGNTAAFRVRELTVIPV